MTPAQRDHFATPVVFVYWLMLVGGLVVYGTTQIDDAASVSSFAALWAGAVGGTLLGQCLALRDFRLWVTAVVVAIVVACGAPLAPKVFAGPVLWQAFVPAALCGFWSLGDRTALAACWFPVVIWMLSILDHGLAHGDATRTPGSTGIVLLGALAVLFVAFLRVRETRRVGLWRVVSPLALAQTKPAELLKEPPARQLARAGWGLMVTAITLGITAWVAPLLWQVEPLGPERARVHAPRGVPCCPVALDDEIERMRVKDYLDLGRGHDARVIRPRGVACRPCNSFGGHVPRYNWRATDHDGPPVVGSWGSAPPVAVRPARPGRARIVGSSSAPGGPIAGQAPVVASREPTRWSTPEIASPAAIEHRPPTAAPAVVTPVAPTQVAPTRVAPVRPTRALVASIATPTRAAEPVPTASPAAQAPRQADPGAAGPLIVRWLMWLALAALIFQATSLALRPVRRLFTLRHLRCPFWDETVAQRISNAWQLALVGLRDAGWRQVPGEAPRELARRVGVDGVERCATILERTRHGIGIDAEDLATMAASADTAYHTARARLGAFARAIGWLRWPLT